MRMRRVERDMILKYSVRQALKEIWERLSISQRLTARKPKLVETSSRCSLQTEKGQPNERQYTSAMNWDAMRVSSATFLQVVWISEILAFGKLASGTCRWKACLTTQKEKLQPMSRATAAVAAGVVKQPKNQPMQWQALVNQSHDRPTALTRNKLKQMFSRYLSGLLMQYLFSYSWDIYLLIIVPFKDCFSVGLAGASYSFSDQFRRVRCSMMIYFKLFSSRVASDAVVCKFLTYMMFFLSCSGPVIQSVTVLGAILGASDFFFFISTFLLKEQARALLRQACLFQYLL